MASFSLLLLLLFLFLHANLLSVAASPSISTHLTTYIVHASKDEIPPAFSNHHDWYMSTLASLKGLHVHDVWEQHKAMYTYETVFHGFTTTLTPSQAAILNEIPGFTTFPDEPLQLHTTHTPQFLRLTSTSGLWPVSDYGDDVIVGVLDTGVWPERPSFSDHKLDDIPARWKGECENGIGFSASLCNKKLIGARAFYKGYESALGGRINETKEHKSARDDEGHGTHTSSTAAGRYVYNASLLGYAPGTARGIAPRARIAVYKVCWAGGCFNSDILAAIESAVIDGVDVISMSLGGRATPYYMDSLAIGTFGAMEKGIVVSCSAGNDGPKPLTVANVAPWIITVAASTVDRNFPSPVTLGNGASYTGTSLYSGSGLGNQQLPLIYAGDAALYGNSSAKLCLPGTLDPRLVANKIVLCDRGVTARVSKAVVVQQAGGAGMILANTQEDGEDLTSDAYTLPGALVGFREGAAIKAYIANATNPSANIAFKGTELGVKPAPVIAAFSSRGPNPLTPQILKPDITAPGVNILAAWTGAVGPSGVIGDKRDVDFNIVSGTSMSCPHVSGIAALVKGAHPDWSPAAIKSALMTTATSIVNAENYLFDGNGLERCNPVSYGAGHVNPEGALNPGLLYDLTAQDYVDFLCGLKYSARMLKLFTKGKYRCSNRDLQSSELNYPSFSQVYDQNISTHYYTTVRRTVTNVGNPKSMYTAFVSAPPGVEVRVHPTILEFSEKNEKLSYDVTFAARSLNTPMAQGFEMAFGFLAWTDGAHMVKSPIAFMWVRDGKSVVQD